MEDCITSADCEAANQLCCSPPGGTRQCYGWSNTCEGNNNCIPTYTCYLPKKRCAPTSYDCT